MLPTYEETAGRLLLCPSILSADFAALGAAIEKIASYADIIHVDVMDGHFVPNFTIGPPVVAALRKYCKIPLDVHLMIENPIEWIDKFAAAGADSLVIHAEACQNLRDGLRKIREAGCSAGVAINPETPLAAVEEALAWSDSVLLMTVHPGLGGQKYIPAMTEKIRILQKVIRRQKRRIHLQIDGGIHAGNIRELYQAGADMIVVGSAVFGAPDPVAALQELRQCAV